MMDHMTGKCQFKESAFITTNNGISAQIFEVWLRAKNSSNILFINTVKARQEKEIKTSQSEENFKGKIDS